jgi:hypothetical protein
VTSADVFERCRELSALGRMCVVVDAMRMQPGSAPEWIDVARVLEQRVRWLRHELDRADAGIVRGAFALLAAELAPWPGAGDGLPVSLPFSPTVH